MRVLGDGRCKLKCEWRRVAHSSVVCILGFLSLQRARSLYIRPASARKVRMRRRKAAQPFRVASGAHGTLCSVPRQTTTAIAGQGTRAGSCASRSAPAPLQIAHREEGQTHATGRFAAEFTAQAVARLSGMACSSPCASSFFALETEPTRRRARVPVRNASCASKRWAAGVRISRAPRCTPTCVLFSAPSSLLQRALATGGIAMAPPHQCRSTPSVLVSATQHCARVVCACAR